MDAPTVRAILVHAGLIDGQNGAPPAFIREDGSAGYVDRRAEVIRHGSAPAPDVPLIVQVSRWDPLKDPMGVIAVFARLLHGGLGSNAELVLAGPNVTAVTDDPEGALTFKETIEAWRALPPAIRARVHLVSLPMNDIQENAAIVNALQRHAAIVVQKSLREGFGLTVTEAMWKARPVVASAVGGIQDQIVDGEHGVLLHEPSDRDAFAAALRRLLEDPDDGRRFGENARRRVADEFLGLHSLARYAALLDRLDRAHEEAGRPEQFVAHA
jgi:trehalose synthase